MIYIPKYSTHWSIIELYASNHVDGRYFYSVFFGASRRGRYDITITSGNLLCNAPPTVWLLAIFMSRYNFLVEIHPEVHCIKRNLPTIASAR